jgi:hypothetical protein
MTHDVTRKPTRMQSRTDREATPLVDDVELSSDESFPASDPPSWTPVARIGSPRTQENPPSTEVRR